MKRETLLALLLPAALALTVVLPGITAETFIHEDEYRNGVMVREMASGGLALFPTLHGTRYPDYPPLYFWLATAAQRAGCSSQVPDGASGPALDSPSPFALRWPAALGAVLVAFGTALAGLRLGSARLGRNAGLLVAVLPGLVLEERRAMIDPLLVGLTTVAVALLASSGREDDEPGGERALRFALAAVCLALGWLTKGPLAALIVGLVLAGGEGLRLELAARQSAKLFLARVVPALALLAAIHVGFKQAYAHSPEAHAGDAPRLVALGVTGLVLVAAELAWLTGSGREDVPGSARRLGVRGVLVALVVLGVAASWYAAAFRIGGSEFGWNLLLAQTIARVSGENEQHAKKWFYFFGVVAVTLPVGLFALQGIWMQFLARARSRAGVFALGWFVLLFAFFSWSHTKRSYYLMPAYPAVALLAACAYEGIARETPRLRSAFRGAHVLVFALLALAAAAVPIAALAEPTLQKPLFCGLAGALFALWTFATLVLRERLAFGLVAGSAFLLASALPLVAPFVARPHSHRELARALLAAGVKREAIQGATHREALCWELAPDAAHGIGGVAEIQTLVNGKPRGMPDTPRVLDFLRGSPPGQAAVILNKDSFSGELDPAVNHALTILAREGEEGGLVAIGLR